MGSEKNPYERKMRKWRIHISREMVEKSQHSKLRKRATEGKTAY